MKKTLLLASMAIAASMQVSAASLTKPTYSRMTLPVSNGYFHGAAVFVDLNNDGLMDIIVKGRDLNNGWATDVKAIFNENNAFGEVKDLPNDGKCWERTVETIDFNNDGYVDYLLLSSWGNELYKNNGDGTFTKVAPKEGDNILSSNINIDGGNNNTELWYTGLSAVADFNMDGYQDIIVIDGSGNPALYINNHGDGSFTLKEDAGLFAQRGGAICVGDYNNDGYPDLLVTGWNDGVGNHCTRINRNNGDGTFTTISPFADELGTQNGSVMFVDVDGDGLLDIFITGESCNDSWNKQARIYRNEGNDKFTQVSVSLTPSTKGGCDWIDVNGDGTIDIIYSGESDNESRTVLAYNEGSLTFTAETPFGRARGGAVVSAFDFNGNGFANVAEMGYNDDGAPHFSVWNGLANNCNANTAPTAPKNLKATANGSKTAFTWEAGSDTETPVAALRYNVYVKTKDGQLITVVPADPETGKLRQGNVNAASNALKYELNIAADQISEWGVQTIDGGKATSAFAKGDTSTGITTVKTGRQAGQTLYDLSGRVATGQTPGIYVSKTVDADGQETVKKVIIK